MNEQKPLSTEDIAGGRREEVTDEQTAYPTDERGAEASRQGTDQRGMEAGYSESGMSNGDHQPALMPAEMAQERRDHWMGIQTRFVDDPKDAVEQADELVAEVMQVVATQFAEQRKGLEGKWQAGGEADSEELRQALLQYRSFFERLLAA
jgi:hypothetical protein